MKLISDRDDDFMRSVVFAELEKVDASEACQMIQQLVLIVGGD